MYFDFKHIAYWRSAHAQTTTSSFTLLGIAQVDDPVGDLVEGQVLLQGAGAGDARHALESQQPVKGFHCRKTCNNITHFLFPPPCLLPS